MSLLVCIPLALRMHCQSHRFTSGAFLSMKLSNTVSRLFKLFFQKLCLDVPPKCACGFLKCFIYSQCCFLVNSSNIIFSSIHLLFRYDKSKVYSISQVSQLQFLFIYNNITYYFLSMYLCFSTHLLFSSYMLQIFIFFILLL